MAPAPLHQRPTWRSIRAAIPWLTATLLTLARTGSSSAAPAAAPAGAPRPTKATALATTPGMPRFFNYASPPGVGDGAGEPSIGSNWTSEQFFANSSGAIPNGGTVTYFGGFLPYMLKVTFSDCQSPAMATWDRKPL